MKRKKWIIPLAVAASLTVSSLAWAEGRYQVIEAYFSPVNYEVNGQSRGESRDSIIHEGRIYVPIRSLSEMLGAQVSWDPASRTVSLDFIRYEGDQIYSLSKQSVYQYIAFENSGILEQFAEHVKATDTEGMKKDIAAWGELEKIGESIDDPVLVDTISRMTTAGELLRSGWINKNFEEYALSWVLFEQSANELDKYLYNVLEVK